MKQISLHDCTKKDESIIVTDNIAGEVYCSTCGMVLKEKTIDITNDSRGLPKEKYFTKSQTGAPSKIYMYDMGTSSIISKKDSDATGNYISSKNKSHFSRLRKWDYRSKHNSKTKGLTLAFINLDSIVNKLFLPENAKEHAAYIYRKAVYENIIRGNSIQSMMAAAVYATCKQLGIPRSLDETAQATDIDRKTLSRTYRRLVERLELDVISVKVNYVSKVANSVDVSEKIKRTSSKILHDAKKEDIHIGKNPVGMAAGAIYLSAIGSGKKITLAKISEKTNISTVTIRKMAQLLRPFAAKYLKSIDITC